MTLNQVGLFLVRACAFLSVGVAAGFSMSLAEADPTARLIDSFASFSEFIKLLRPYWAWLALVGLVISFLKFRHARLVGLVVMLLGVSMTLFTVLAFVRGGLNIL